MKLQMIWLEIKTLKLHNKLLGNWKEKIMIFVHKFYRCNKIMIKKVKHFSIYNLDMKNYLVNLILFK